MYYFAQLDYDIFSVKNLRAFLCFNSFFILLKVYMLFILRAVKGDTVLSLVSFSSLYSHHTPKSNQI
jgi:hypothetical protein